MFHAFEDVLVMSQEVQLSDFVNYTKANPEGAKTIVGKRTEYTIFSNVLSEIEIKKQLDIIASNDIIIINCVRDGRQVVESWWRAWKTYNPFAWMVSIIQSFEYESVIKMTVKYEDLVLTPDIVQSRIELLTGLKSWKKFSEYPDFCTNTAFKADDPKYKLRKLRISENTEATKYLNKPNCVKVFNELNEKIGYK